MMRFRVRERLRHTAEATETVAVVIIFVGFVLVHMVRPVFFVDVPHPPDHRRSHA